MKIRKIDLVILLCVFSLFFYTIYKEEPSIILKYLKDINITIFLLCFVLMFIYWFLDAITLKILSKDLKEEVGILKLFEIVIITNFFNSITPFASGGQPMQIYMLTKEKINTIKSTAISIQNFIVYQLVLVLMGSISLLPIFTKHLGDTTLISLVYIGFIINFMVFFGLILMAYTKWFNKIFITTFFWILSILKIIKNIETKKLSLTNFVDNFHGNMNSLLKNKLKFLSVVFINIAKLLIFYSIPYFIAMSMNIGYSINLLETILLSSYVFLIVSFVPLPGGSGGAEFAFKEFFGTTLATSVLGVVGVFWRFITYYFILIVGFIFFLNYNRNLRKKETT